MSSKGESDDEILFVKAERVNRLAPVVQLKPFADEQPSSPVANDEDANFQCKVCPKVFASKKNLLQHEEKHNKVWKKKPKIPLEIPISNLPEKRPDVDPLQVNVEPVIEPLDETSPVPQESPEPLPVLRNYPCSQCKKVFLNEQHFLNHVASTHDKPRLKRRVEQQAAKQKPAKEEPTSFTCKYCGQVFAKKTSLTGHLHIHKGRVPENGKKCTICGEICSSKGNTYAYIILFTKNFC